MTYDLVTLGEVMLRLAVPAPGRIETARQLDVQIGGAEANVAAACARLGLRTAWLSALPANPWGERIRRELTGHGVDCAGVRMVEGARVGLYYLEYGAPPRPVRVIYDRRESAFARLAVDDIDWASLRQARLVHLTGITPALGPGPRALVERALSEAATISFDVNYRATLWIPAEARAFIDGVLPRARYIFAGLEEVRLIWGLEGEPEQVLEVLARRAPQATVTVLMGEAGSITRDGARVLRPDRRHAVQVVDPIGAGDAFAAGFLWAALRGCDLQETIDTAGAVAALKCSMWGDIALVGPRDVEELLAGGPGMRR
ncbi:MAG TPA: sugar kinase [Methylomirabilota bacterium]|nr:sugar kinase [Methylomirabilota bacterium]